jgi:hypothetical protein
MTPVTFAVVLVAAIMLATLPRKHAPAPILIAAFLLPVGQQLMVAGVHFYVVRILVLIGLGRLTVARMSSTKPVFPAGFSDIDKALCLLTIVEGAASILREKASGAVVYHIALWVDTFGLYFIMRHLLQESADILRLIKMFALVVGVLGVCMLYENRTRIDLFSYLAGHQIVPWIREGRVRAQAGFANSITAGCFGATLVPLFWFIWKEREARLLASIGLAAATVVTITSMASTPITGYVAVIIALCLWPIRKRMRWVRWGVGLVVLALSAVMKAPVWFLLSRINIAGGNAYDRAILIDVTVRHFSDWWLVGTSENANWGFVTWDACNQFAAEALSGGLAALVVFIVLLRRTFGAIGRCRKTAEGRRDEWLFWSLGAALFAHVIVFLGVDYFDQTKALWLIFLAMVSSRTLCVGPVATGASYDSATEWFWISEEQVACR